MAIDLPKGEEVQVNALIRWLCDSRGRSMNAVSGDLGRSREYVRQSSLAKAPALGTVADVADVLGYDLAIIDRKTGEAVAVIEPPRRASADDRG